MSAAARPPVPSTARSGHLSYAIFTLARAHRARAAGMLRELGLHPGQELLLMQLFDRDGQSQSELLESAGLDHSTVSKSVKRMQEAGLLTRTPSEHDRRVMNVHLTDQGRALRRPIEKMWAALEATATEGLDPAAVEAFVATALAVEQSICRSDRADASADADGGTGTETNRPTGRTHRP
ncbi:transcriptional regulator [Streptomyces amritsarensis]|uniref:Transcriptional regulator n=1 Tax=Streptomyces amritsarensis TaxID=681158 RepID=A0ABX3FWS8_9ACTN|nr:MarR family winged helix-turn-helix transcriptional regulator [Streptomyces amritsarensis]OLZ53863.1 transcriptional regulator [Streptomyces amritsarensis]